MSINEHSLRVIAILDEGTKKYVEGRHISYPEMGLNILGATIGVGIVNLI